MRAEVNLSLQTVTIEGGTFVVAPESLRDVEAGSEWELSGVVLQRRSLHVSGADFVTLRLEGKRE